ncbi:MAG: tetratricopeptide repeat protein, partial [Candidatus Aminicenantaceae bacterium]
MKKRFHLYIGGIFLVASFFVFKIMIIGSYVPLSSFEDIPLRMLFGDKLLNKGQFEKAIDVFTSVLEIAEEKCDYRNLVKCLLALGLLHWNVGELDASRSCYEQAYEIASTHKLKREALEAQKAKRIYSYYQKGKDLKDQRKYQESIQMFDAAIKLAKELESKHHELKCIRQMSINHWEMSEFEDFYVLNKKALHFAEDLNHMVEVVRALNHIGLYYWRLNQYSQALVAYSKSLDIVKLGGNMGELSTVINNIGIIYKEYGNFKKALEFLFEALRIDRKAENDDFCAIDLINIGTIYRKLAALSKDMGDFEKSIQFFEESLGLAQKNGDIDTEIAALNNLGDLFIQLGDYEAALKYLNKGIEKANAAKKIYYTGVLCNNIGFASHELRDSKASLKCYYDAVDIGLEISSYDILWEAYYGLGLCYEKAGSDIKASEYFQMSADVIDKLRSRITLDVDKAGFAKDKTQVYHKLVELYFRHFNSSHSPYHIKSIFKTIERAKARAFLDLLNEANVIIQDKLTPELVEQENKISESIATELNKLARENHSIAGRELILKHLDLLEDKYTSFMNKVRVEIPELSEIVSPEPCSLEQVQSILLNNETILLEYFVGNDRSFLLAITENDSRLCELPARQYIQD